jgi:hypothetical protein
MSTWETLFSGDGEIGYLFSDGDRVGVVINVMHVPPVVWPSHLPRDARHFLDAHDPTIAFWQQGDAARMRMTMKRENVDTDELRRCAVAVATCIGYLPAAPVSDSAQVVRFRGATSHGDNVQAQMSRATHALAGSVARVGDTFEGRFTAETSRGEAAIRIIASESKLEVFAECPRSVPACGVESVVGFWKTLQNVVDASLGHPVADRLFLVSGDRDALLESVKAEQLLAFASAVMVDRMQVRFESKKMHIALHSVAGVIDVEEAIAASLALWACAHPDLNFLTTP